jgi:hypothetical protein
MQFTGVYPNPASDDVNFVVKLSRNAEVKVRVFTVSGELAATISKACVTGQNAVMWDAKSPGGKREASGVYLFILDAVTERNEKMTAKGKFSIVK